jgi:hypothetical protein
MALSMGFRPLVSLQSAIQATGLLVLTLAGLTPAEDASLSLDARLQPKHLSSYRTSSQRKRPPQKRAPAIDNFSPISTKSC